MSKDNSIDFLYLNKENSWPDFQMQGLEICSDGALQLDSASGAAKGVLWSSAITLGTDKVNWHRLKICAHPLPSDAHLQCFIYTSDDETDNPTVDPSNNTPFADYRWRAMPLDALDLFIGGDAIRYLWLGIHFQSGASTPVVSQIRVEFNHETYARYLPSIYRKSEEHLGFLIRLLSLFETLFGDVEEKINDLPVLFDPASVPEDFLAWLADWLALGLNEDWTAEHKREVIHEAFEIYGWRGTPEGLRKAMKLFAEVDVRIEEPILSADWWSLAGESSSPHSFLGFTTMLLPAYPQGAIVGTTAVLNQSHLITNEEFGAPLFKDLAHRFSVQIYESQVKCAKKLEELRALIDQEKPAHTSYHLCVIKPRMRVGFQSRIGIDSIIGGGPLDLVLDKPRMLGFDTVIPADTGSDIGGSVGKDARVGTKTVLTKSHDDEEGEKDAIDQDFEYA